MIIEKYTELSRVHFEQRLWQNELEMIQIEVGFFQDLLKDLEEANQIAAKNQAKVGEFFNHIHHFQRLTKKLLEEKDLIEFEIAEGVLHDIILDKNQRLDHKYFRSEMDYLEQNYRIFKTNFKNFIANTHFGTN
jgi:hypothetical protein